MDDKRFDDLIKKKADGFTDTGHDAHALTDLRNRLSGLANKRSGWSPGKTAYAIGAMVLFTLINFGIVWYFSEGRYVTLNHEIDQLKGQSNRVVAMQDELATLRSIKTDTVYIYRNLISSQQSAASGLPNLTRGNREETINRAAQFTPREDQYYAQMSENQLLSDELKSFLSENNLLLSTTDGELVLVVNNSPVKPLYTSASDTRNARKPGAPRYLSEVATYEDSQLDQKQVEKKKMPKQMLWALEKHQHHGVDWQFGVEGIYHKSNFDIGDGDTNSGVGLMAEAIFSPTWRLEAGVNFGARSYGIKESEIQSLPAAFFDDYPGYDGELGELATLESDVELVKFPINLKYFSILDHNKKWYLSAGLTPQWATRQELDYKYVLDVDSPPVGDSEYVSFVGSKQEIESSYYTTTVNLGVGTEVYLNERLRWQLGLFYQKGLSEVGAEKRKLTSSYGIKTSLWFNNP
ncbi:MAG: hypothetical protein DHS20C17_09750 [Cyclobacteriaceae bacterium]|nr:MAG: hypothetical protein DHS20C17_09750 [Cyclobacteriaceae bacterium]